MDFLLGVGGEEGSAMAVGVATDKKKATLQEVAVWAVSSEERAVRLAGAANGGEKLLGSKVVFVGLKDAEMNAMTGNVTECCADGRYVAWGGGGGFDQSQPLPDGCHGPWSAP